MFGSTPPENDQSPFFLHRVDHSFNSSRSGGGNCTPPPMAQHNASGFLEGDQTPPSGSRFGGGNASGSGLYFGNSGGAMNTSNISTHSGGFQVSGFGCRNSHLSIPMQSQDPNHLGVGGAHPAPASGFHHRGNPMMSAMCTPQTSKEVVDMRQTVDKEVMDVNCMMRRYFPQLVTQLSDNLFIGAYPSEESFDTLLEKNITHFINVSNEPGFYHDDFQTFEVNTRDETDYYILDNHLDEFCGLITDILESDPDARIYIHCIAGVNRSVTLTIGYLMKCRNFDLIEAIKHFRDCGKHVILENQGFRHQLVELQLSLEN